ncbi:DUF4160 domain-containing protein [Lachnospiraceae bacterium ZAX-1]
MEGYAVPSLFKIGGYIVYFWSNENNEPIHVHVGKGKSTPNATKIWLTATDRCLKKWYIIGWSIVLMHGIKREHIPKGKA